MCFLSRNVGKTLFCFLFLFSWFQKHFVCEKIRFIFPLFFWITLINPSLSSLWTTTKFSPKSLVFVFVPSLFCFTFFFFQHFPCFFRHFVLCSLFPLHLFVHLFLLFSPFFFSLISPFFLYFSISVFLSRFFSVSRVSLTFFLHRRFCVSSFCFTLFFFSIFCSWSHFAFHTSSLPFFHHLRIYFFNPKNSKNSVVNFSRWIYVCFLNPPFFGVSSLVFPCVVLIPCLFHVLLIISASWHYFSWFSSINLLFGSLQKKCRFVFEQRFQKISLILF